MGVSMNNLPYCFIHLVHIYTEHFPQYPKGVKVPLLRSYYAARPSHSNGAYFPLLCMQVVSFGGGLEAST